MEQYTFFNTRFYTNQASIVKSKKTTETLLLPLFSPLSFVYFYTLAVPLA